MTQFVAVGDHTIFEHWEIHFHVKMSHTWCVLILHLSKKMTFKGDRPFSVFRFHLSTSFRPVTPFLPHPKKKSLSFGSLCPRDPPSGGGWCEQEWSPGEPKFVPILGLSAISCSMSGAGGGLDLSTGSRLCKFVRLLVLVLKLTRTTGR